MTMNIARLRDELARLDRLAAELDAQPASRIDIARDAVTVAMRELGAGIDKRAHVGATTRFKFVSSGKRKLRGVASSISVDRQGDIVVPAGGTWKLPIPLLWQHDHKCPVGFVNSLTLKGDELLVEAELAEGVGRADEIWGLIEAGVLNDFSIGFRGLEQEPIATGWRWKRWELLELSVVAVGANQDAKIRRNAGRDAPVKLLPSTAVKLNSHPGSVKLLTTPLPGAIPLVKRQKPVRLIRTDGAVSLLKPESR